MFSKKPVIGITLDAEAAGGYSPLPWYALRKEYFSVLARYGAVPLALPHELSCADQYLDQIDGLLLSGGDFDIPPEMYGMSVVHDSVITKNERTNFEIAMTKGSLDRKIPILGVCAGEQLLNVLLGGTLVQHIPDEIPNALEHQQPTPRTEAWHDVTVQTGTMLYDIVQTTRLSVNSNHHQAVKDTGEHVKVSAHADDGVVEAIEYTQHPFCLGVEWHPELEVSSGDRAIMQAFIAACM